MKQTRGTLYLVACRQTVSDCASTPSLPSNTATAPSSTRIERSTSAVKSTWPGVSIRFTVYRSPLRSHGQVVAAELMRSEEHTTELQSPCNLVCRLQLEKKKNS